MKIANKTIKLLLAKYKQISLLNKIGAVLDWDLNVNLPPKAAEARSEQSAYLTGLVTDKWLDLEFKKLLEQATNLKALNQEEAAIVRNLNHAAKFYTKVPKEIIVEFTKTTSEAFMVWQKARRENKFKDFAPFLKRIVHLNQIIAKHLGYKKNPYDPLLDQYEQGLTVAKTVQIFNKLRPQLTILLKKVQKSKKYLPKHELVEGDITYPVESQKQLALFALKKINYDLEAGRMDVSAHPFTTELDTCDVRITNRYKDNEFRESLMIAMHEGGHALYEQGVKKEYAATPLGGGVSYAIHESQSRFWENQVGRNPLFIKWLFPTLQAFYPTQLGGVGDGIVVNLFNMVKPSLIRTLADEVTYGLHIILRFEVENDLINGKIKVEDVPKVWNAKMKKYLGVTPKTDASGCLQDVHWSYGNFGYFPTYLLGNLYAAQFSAKMKKELPFDELVGRGELGTILDWLRENIHQYGSLYWPSELIKKVTGEALNPQFFINYLKEKYSDIYDLTK